jgi:hypothetical protein
MRRIKTLPCQTKGNNYTMYFDVHLFITVGSKAQAANVHARCGDFFTKELYAVHALLFDLNCLVNDYRLVLPKFTVRDIQQRINEINIASDYVSDYPKGPNFNYFLIQKFALMSGHLHRSFTDLRHFFKKFSNTAMVYKSDYCLENTRRIQEQRKRLELIFEEWSIEIPRNFSTKKYQHDRQYLPPAS